MKKIITPLVFGFFSLCVNAQQIDSETGNIVYTTLNPAPPGTPYTWNGFTVQNTGGGGLSGGNIPAYNPNTGTFIFGYNQGTVSYSTSVNFALANAGTGLQINGFKYSWQYYNQDYSRGTLTGNISLTSNTGQILQSYGYNMPKTTNGWTSMSGIQNFATQYPLSGVGNLNVSFTGKDDRWWAGYYGPQIRDISVKMLYSMQVPDFSSWVKLSDENYTFTLSKSGIVRYGANDTYIYKSYEPGTYECSNGAWGKDPLGGVYKSCSLGTNTTTSNPLPTTNTTTTNNTTTAVINDITTAAAQPTTTSPTTTIVETNTTIASGTTSPTPTTTTSSSQTTSSSSSSSSASTTTSTPTATASATTSSSPSGGRTVDGTSIGLSVVSRNAQREQTIAMQAAQNAVAATEQTAQQSQQEAVSVAQSSSAASNLNSAGSTSRTSLTTQRSEQSVALSQTTQTSSSFMNNFAQPGQQTNMSRSNDTSRYGLTTNVSPEIANVQTTPLSVTALEQTTNNQSQTTFTLLPPQQPQQIVTQTPIFVVNETNQSKPVFSNTNQQTIAITNEVTTSETQKLLTDRTNPMNELIEGRNMELPTTSTIQQKTTVNTNVSDNQIAGGVNITRIAVAPVGYNQYLNIVIADAAFYAPKEIYKGQKNVDNVRALRQMSSDKLHQEMVNQQYRRN